MEKYKKDDLLAKKIERDTKIRSRIYLIDFLRGIAVILMIVDHFCYDFISLMPFIFHGFPSIGPMWTMFHFLQDYWDSSFRLITREFVLTIFLLLTGICCSFSKSNLIRGIKLAIAAFILSMATIVISDMIGDSEAFISFGVLNNISLCLIIIGLLETKFTKNWVYLVIGLSLFIIGFVIRFIVLKGELPVIYYHKENFFIILLKEMVGLCKAGGDTSAFTFYGGQVFIGVFLGRILYPTKKSRLNIKYIRGPVSFLGRNSLIVYFAHQIIIPFVLTITLIILGYTFSI